MKYIGQLVTGNLRNNTLTFEIEGEMTILGGKYSIELIPEEEEEQEEETNIF